MSAVIKFAFQTHIMTFSASQQNFLNTAYACTSLLSLSQKQISVTALWGLPLFPFSSVEILNFQIHFVSVSTGSWGRYNGISQSLWE